MELDSNIQKEVIPSEAPVEEGEVTKVKYEKKHYSKDNDFRGERDSRKKFFKRKVCQFCKNNMDVVDYKDVKLLKRYIKESGKILPKRLTGTCSKHQRMVTSAIKRARNIALLPYETRY